MSLLPKIEKITSDATVSHFFLMFGYKLFSLYFPLFLVARGMSLPEVGYTYLLIYLPIAFFAPIVGFFNHKINPAILAGLGIAGYALYSLGMIRHDFNSKSRFVLFLASNFRNFRCFILCFITSYFNGLKTRKSF